jgi:hypothetical protein
MATPSPLLGALAGAALVGGAWAVTHWSSLDAAPPPELGAAHGDVAAGRDARAILERLERIERRLASLGAGAPRTGSGGLDPARGPTLEGPRRTDVVDAGRDAAREGVAPGASAPASSEDLISEEVLERTLERTLDRLEEKRLEGYSNKDLRAQAQRLMNKDRDLVGARRLLEHLLARDLEPLERVEVLTDRGAAERGLGDHAASERTLREAMHLGGTDTEQGVAAGYHLVWTLSRAEQPGQALRLADDLLAARGLSSTMRPWMRWAGARLALQTGDTARARADYRALLDDVEGNAAYEQIAKDAMTNLAALE